MKKSNMLVKEEVRKQAKKILKQNNFKLIIQRDPSNLYNLAYIIDKNSQIFYMAKAVDVDNLIDLILRKLVIRDPLLEIKEEISDKLFVSKLDELIKTRKAIVTLYTNKDKVIANIKMLNSSVVYNLVGNTITKVLEKIEELT